MLWFISDKLDWQLGEGKNYVIMGHGTLYQNRFLASFSVILDLFHSHSHKITVLSSRIGLKTRKYCWFALSIFSPLKLYFHQPSLWKSSYWQFLYEFIEREKKGMVKWSVSVEKMDKANQQYIRVFKPILLDRTVSSCEWEWNKSRISEKERGKVWW
jgi:hypothetical protein